LQEETMLHRNLIIGIAAALSLSATGASAFDEAKYPDWSGQWRRPPNVGVQWDQNKPPALGQQAPLKPEYVKLLEESLKDQENGGQGLDSRFTCRPNGMPRLMTMVWPAEFVITPNITFYYSENNMPRRIYTDGRSFPKDQEPSYDGVSIGHWLDTDGDGRYDTLDTETRYFKGPRAFDASGLPLAFDNRSVFKERFFVDAKNFMHIDTTVIDNALWRPWTSDRQYYRVTENVVQWPETWCQEGNANIIIGGENYFLRADGLLMPSKRDQKPPDLKYFSQSQK
jgi:hypothetical protein